MKQRICFVFVCAFVACLGMASMAVAATGAAGDGVIVISPVAPTLGAANTELDDEVMYGMVGTITSGMNTSGRYQVRTQYNYTTYINSADLAIVTSEQAQNWKNSRTHWVIAPFADVLPRPDFAAYPPLITLPRGSLLAAVPAGDDWYATTLYDGRTGYVKKDRLREKWRWGQFDEAATRGHLRSDTLSYIGSIYRWGGKTPFGLDCSGFSSMVYMLNGLDTYRNSRAEPGYPIALMHIEANGTNSTSTHTLATLARAKPGDMLYWSGHQGVYIGDGKYVHSNGSSYNNRMNSLIPDETDPAAPYRSDLGTYGAIYTWGTAFPERPNELIVRRFVATPTAQGSRQFRFYARVDGYTPNRGILYPYGIDSDGTLIKGEPVNLTGSNCRYMLYESQSSTSGNVPSFTYPSTESGNTYYPAVVFINDAGWRPTGETITSDVYVMPVGITVP